VSIQCYTLVSLLGSCYVLVSSAHLHLSEILAHFHSTAHWRQTHSRPWKPLPLDATHSRQLAARAPIRRRIANFFISCLCLGIPYFFMERVQMLRADEESGLQAPGPKLVIWACTCLAVGVQNILHIVVNPLITSLLLRLRSF
jgi:hypothetical protein